MTILGVIPARGGSKGLPGKNLMILNHVSLIGRALESASQSKRLTRVVVSTDSPAIATEAKRHGGYVIDRPAELATDEAGMLGVLQHAVRVAGGRPAIIVCLQPTSPFRTGAMIDATIQKVLDGADSAQTLTEAPDSPFFMSTLAGDRVTPLFTHTYVCRQECPPVYMPNGAVYATSYRTLMEEGKILGTDHRAIVCNFEDSVNIDTLWDYRMAELIAGAR